MAQRVDSFMEDERVHRQNMADAINSIESRGAGFVGSFTRDTAAASGSVSYTGVGFKPQGIVFLSNQSTTTETSVGLDDGTTGRAISKTSVGDAWSIFVGASIALVETDGASSHTGTVTSFDDDGFTIAWTKTGTPTGTGTVFYLALR